jgi:3-oxoacyl-[acyl-carrier protein] reductase
MRLAGKTAIVTGAASGFGRGIAELFAREGARLALLDLNEAGVRDVAAAIGGDVLALRCDVADGASVKAAVAAALERFGEVGIVVNNAGISGRCSRSTRPSSTGSTPST